MVKRCFVPHCKTGCRSNREKWSIFKAPNDKILLEKWNELIPPKDRPLTSKDYVCEKHFEERFVIPRFKPSATNVDFYLDLSRTKLVPNAVPTIFPDSINAENVIEKYNLHKRLSNIQQINNFVRIKGNEFVKKFDKGNERFSNKTLQELDYSYLNKLELNEIVVDEDEYIPICYRCLTEKK